MWPVNLVTALLGDAVALGAAVGLQAVSKTATIARIA
jgi:hypothetical protein